MIDNQLSDHAQPAFVRFGQKRAEIVKRSVVRINVVVIGDVVAVIAQWRRIKRQEPDRGNPEFLEIIQFLDQAAKIANPIAVAVVKSFDVQLVDDRVFVPKRITDDWFSGARRHAINLCRTKRAAQRRVSVGARSTSSGAKKRPRFRGRFRE